ncbi:hypothetical protein D3C76_354600 [compost metagenome]
MLTGIDQRVELAFAVPGDDQRLTAGAQGDEVVFVGDLAFVARIDPVFLENQLHLEIEQRRLSEHVTGDAVHALRWTKVQAALDEVLPLGN